MTGRGVGTWDCEYETPASVCKSRSRSVPLAFALNPNMPAMLRLLVLSFFALIAILASVEKSSAVKISAKNPFAEHFFK